MKVKEVPFSWIPRSGYRLDVEPFVGGAVETRVFLERAAYPKQPLHELTTGHNGGIYNGPMFRRNYVESREHGVPPCRDLVGVRQPIRRDLLSDQLFGGEVEARSPEDVVKAVAVGQHFLENRQRAWEEGNVRIRRDLLTRSRPDEDRCALTGHAAALVRRADGIAEMVKAHGHEHDVHRSGREGKGLRGRACVPYPGR